MKVKGFFKDVGGASRVAEWRKKAIEEASSVIVRSDPINEVARALHPSEPISFVVSDIRDVSPTARTYRLEPENGTLPVFQAGQYVSLMFNADGTSTCRPYSISSAPFEARGDKPFIEITVRKKGETFVPDYLFREVKKGDKIQGSMPFGHFNYEPLRDAKRIVALAGGSGITPFYSMAREIEHGTLDCELTILYGSAKSDDIILKDELDAIKSDKVKVIHVLSDEPEWTGEKGFLTKELIGKYSDGDVSYFVCGPQAMYRFVAGQLAEMGVKRRRIRREVFGAPREVAKTPGFPAECVGKTFNITVRRGIHEDVIPAKAEETVVVALERAGIPVLTDCRSGECGFCRSELVSGSIFVSPDGDGRRLMDKELGWFHPCASYPTSDLVIKIPII